MPPLDATDSKTRQIYMNRENPGVGAQYSSALQVINGAPGTSMEYLQAMVDAGWVLTDPAMADDGGRTLLHSAAKIGNEEGVKFMLKQGSPIDAFSKFGETPLHLAVRNNKLACVKLLVEAGADPSLKYGIKAQDSYPALTLAERYKFRPIVEYLKSKGATGESGNTYPCLLGECASAGPEITQ